MFKVHVKPQTNHCRAHGEGTRSIGAVTVRLQILSCIHIYTYTLAIYHNIPRVITPVDRHLYRWSRLGLRHSRARNERLRTIAANNVSIEIARETFEWGLPPTPSVHLNLFSRMYYYATARNPLRQTIIIIIIIISTHSYVGYVCAYEVRRPPYAIIITACKISSMKYNAT